MSEFPASFIVFEGGDGAGKSTQIRKLADYLAQTYPERRVVVTREPGGLQQGEDIRSLFVRGEPDRWQPISEILLLFAARYEHLEHVIRPALAQGDIVLCDRFIFSTYAYQHFGKGADRALIDDMVTRIVAPTLPNLTLYLDIDPDIGLSRTHDREGQAQHETRFERTDRRFHDNLREGYHKLAAEYADTTKIIDASQSLEQVHADIIKAVSLLGSREWPRIEGIR